jgi:hypothetical protein
MTPDEFDQDASPLPDVTAGPAAVPAVPDECGTAPLFGDETPVPRLRTAGDRPARRLDQLELF